MSNQKTMTQMKQTFFDRVASGITSLGAVLCAMLFMIVGSLFFSHTLFIHIFPDTMSTWEKLASGWFMAIGWEFTVLIATVNPRHVPPVIAKILALCSGVIVLFFIDAFATDITTATTVQRLFVGALVSVVNYIYVHLFSKKWNERIYTQTLPAINEQLESRVRHLEAELKQVGARVEQRESELKQTGAKLEELEAYKRRTDDDLTCPYCRQVQKTRGSLVTHKGHCSHNPKNGVKLNGHSHVTND